MLARERPRPKRGDDRIQLAADPRDLGLRDPVHARAPSPGHRPSASRRRARTPPARRPAARARPAGAAAASDGKYVPGRTFGIASSIVPTRVSHVRVRVPLRYAVRSPLRSCRSAPIRPGDLRLHQRLREHADAFPQHVAILLLEELANKRRQIHPWLGHRRQHLRVVLLLPERTHGKMRDGRFAVSRGRPYRISTTSGDSNDEVAGPPSVLPRCGSQGRPWRAGLTRQRLTMMAPLISRGQVGMKVTRP